MRNLMYVSALGLFLSASALPFALTAQENSWLVGIVVGNSFSDLSPENEILGNAIRTGANLGVRVAHRLNDHLVIQANALYEKKGHDWSSSLTDVNGQPIRIEEKSYVDYAVLPVTIQWRFGKEKLQYGPYLGAYAATWLRQEKILVETEQGSDPIEYAFRKADWGAVGGFGLEYKPKGNFSLSLEGRYNLGLADVSALPAEKANFRSVAWLLGVNYVFGKG